MVMDYWASTLLEYKSYIGMDVTISLTRQSVKLYMMLWIYGHLVLEFTSHKGFSDGVILNNFPACNG